jgi:hypothetical protein
MKTKTLLFSTAFLLLILSACTSSDADRTHESIAGIWTFETLSGEYAELWAGDTAMIVLKVSSPTPGYFSYEQSADSVKLFLPGKKEKATMAGFFIITSRSDTNIILQQDSVTNQLILIDANKPDIQDSEEFATQLIEDFSGRALKGQQ